MIYSINTIKLNTFSIHIQTRILTLKVKQSYYLKFLVSYNKN